MYLKRLEIQGFKSFANKTTLEFLPPKDGRFSVTAVVGPNGAGKSNISDAILWVMGEQSLKALRGKKSEDIIFSGSEAKGQLSAAEVSLVLDNSDGRVMNDYPEISITRRLYRSGEGEYLINNNSVRLFDVHLLLAKAQFGQHSYSIVGQGMIDRLLAVSPAERKDFMDEAAGIKEFQIKRHQADLRLARTRENMTQAERLLQEVEPRLKLLGRQVKKLEKRQEVELKLREAQETYYTTIFIRNQNEYDALQKNLGEIEKGYRAVFAELETTRAQLAELARSSSRQEVFQELQHRHQEAVRLKNDLERRLAILEGQMHAEYSQAGQQNIGWLESKIKELRGHREKLSGGLSLARGEARRLNGLAAEHKQTVEDFSVEKTQGMLKISRLQGEMFKDQSEQNYLQLSGLTAVRAVLETRQRFGKIYGLVAELGEVEEGYRLALETAAGAHLSSIVVEDERVARLAIDYLRANRFGVATFLPLNKIQPRPAYGDAESLLSEPGVLGSALNLIKFDAKFFNIFSFIFGGALVVKDLAVAERVGIGRARMVTVAGDLADKNGVMKGGYKQGKNNLTFSSALSFNSEDRLAEYQAAISLAQSDLADLEKKIEAGKVKLLEAQVQARSASAKADILEEESRAAERESAGLEQELAVLRSGPEQYGEQLKKLGKEKEKITARILDSEAAIAEISQEIENFNRKEEEKKQRVFALQNEMQERQALVNEALSRRNDLKIQMAKIETRQESLAQEAFNDMHTSLAALVKRAPGIAPAEEPDRIADEMQKLKYQLSLIGGIDDEVTKEYEDTKIKYDFLTGQLADLRKASGDLALMIEELDELMKKKRASEFKKIRREFSRYFKILFGGGTADLREMYGEIGGGDMSADAGEQAVMVALSSCPGRAEGVAVEPAEPRKRERALTGIEVVVNPPGKRIKYMAALSGGERTLTSIALICAILNCNPSPFVVLDEVEAALDEANSARFAQIVSELSVQSQFIVITHNRVTMHASDALYGVVMGGDGVSKLLSVKMKEAEKYEQVPVIDKNSGA